MFNNPEKVENHKTIEHSKFVDGCILTEKHEWHITEEDGVETQTQVYKRSCNNGSCGVCNQEIEEKTVTKSGEEPTTIINTAMSEEELEDFEKCWKEKWPMDKQEIISKVLEDIPPVEQMKKEEVEKI